MGTLEEVLANLANLFGSSLLNLLAGIIILVVGYVVAKLVAGGVRRLLARTGIDNRLAKVLGGESPVQIEELIARVVFYVLMFLVIVAFLQRVNLDVAAGPLQTMLDQFFLFIPQLVAAAAILLIAWIVASIVRLLVNSGARALRLDSRLSDAGALEGDAPVSVSESLATALFWLVFFLFLPAVLSALEMDGLVAPAQAMFTDLLGYVPNIFGAALVFIIGWFVARIVRQVVTNLAAAAGADGLGERVGLGNTVPLSRLLGTVVYTLILIPVLIQALNSLNVDAISGPATRMLETILAAIPAVFGAAVVLIVSYFVARLVANLVMDLLAGAGFNSLPGRIGIKMDGSRTPTQLVGYLIIVSIMLFAAIEAADLLGFDRFAEIVATIMGFGGQVLVGLVILLVGLYLANVAHGIIMSAGEQASFTATLARTAILVLVGAMALRQMGIADDIVNLAFGILLGAIGVAAALAFGLGSREIAGREVERLVSQIRAEGSPSDDSAE